MIDSSGMNYRSFLTTLEENKAEIRFEEKIANLKKGNNYVFFEMNEGNYLVNKSSWIKINSRNNLVSIDDEKTVPAFQINKYVDRNDITGMTPLDGKNTQFAIYTIPVDNGVRPLKKSIDSPKNNHLTQNGASREQIAEYNMLAKKYNKQKEGKRSLRFMDVQKLHGIYKLMTAAQKEAAEPFPYIPPPPPPVDSTEEGDALTKYRTPSGEAIEIIKDATPKELKEYNSLSKKYNSMLSKGSDIRIKMKEVKRLEYLYSVMSDKQKATAEPFPDFPEPPPEPEAPKRPKNVADIEYDADQIKTIIKNQDPYDDLNTIAALTYNNGRNSSFRVSNIPKTPSSRYVARKSKIRKIEFDMSKKELELVKMPTGFTQSPTPPEPEIPTYLKTKNAIIEAHPHMNSIKSPPNPPSPKQPLDHLIDMAKQGANFYFEGKKISSDKAIELLKKNKNLNIRTTKTNSEAPQIKIYSGK